MIRFWQVNAATIRQVWHCVEANLPKKSGGGRATRMRSDAVGCESVSYPLNCERIGTRSLNGHSPRTGHFCSETQPDHQADLNEHDPRCGDLFSRRNHDEFPSHPTVNRNVGSTFNRSFFAAGGRGRSQKFVHKLNQRLIRRPSLCIAIRVIRRGIELRRQ